MSIYSYHIFYFPFEWKRKNRKDETFSEQIKLEGIELKPGSCWERVNREPDTEGEKKDFFNERQYYFPFVHPIMYDMKDEESSLMHHYERKEPKEKEREVTYIIKIKVNKDESKEYRLRVDSMNLNLYSTGVGVLTLFLANSETKEKEDILNINQFGRRIMLPFYGDKEGRGQTAESLCITGLEGEGTDYYTETFDDITPSKNATWKPAKFITRLISDLSDDIDTDNIHPIIDDRMLVNCWYPNNELAARVKDDKDFIMGDFWYRYIFVDGSSEEETCQNDEMKEKLLKESTYQRWQKRSTLYGLTRYSLMALTDEGEYSCNVLAKHMRTIYSRMFELVIVQRASILRFSGEVTRVSKLHNEKDHELEDLAERIKSLYKEYISFANQIYLTYVTAQDQGIEMYDMLMRQFTSADKVKDLDNEIDELYRFITLLIEKKQNEIEKEQKEIEQEQSNTGRYLNKIAIIFLPATILVGIFGISEKWSCWTTIGFVLVIFITCVCYCKWECILNWIKK